MWWNFVARTHEEIAEARREWEQHEVFGDVPRSLNAKPRLAFRSRPFRPDSIHVGEEIR